MEFQKLKGILEAENLAYTEHAPMSEHTTFKIGGPARMMLCPKTAEELTGAVAACVKAGAAYRVIGNGSNLLVADTGIHAAVILTAGIKTVPKNHGDNGLWASAGESLASLCNRAQTAGLSGLEFAYGIPGSVGGAVYMNAGAYGGEMQNVVLSVTVFNPGTERTYNIPADELKFAYRHSLFMEQPLVILDASFGLTPADPAAIRDKMVDYMSRRREKQPLEWPSAGSTFKRPVGAYAAALIDQCGLKGMRIGGAMVSEKHAGFVINAGGATCADVTALMDEIRRIVREKTGYDLEPEVRVFG